MNHFDNQQQQSNPGLTPEKLQLFIAGLSGMPVEEANKAKLLFIKNEIAELRMFKTQFASFGQMQGCFAFIPFFTPMIKGQKNLMNAAQAMHVEQLENALSVWGDDLGHHTASLREQLNELKQS